MIMRILILAYIAFVLAISSFARAAQTQVGGALIDQAQVQQATGILSVHGVLSTPCQTKPALFVKQIDESSSKVELDITTVSTGDLCMDVLGPDFNLAFDLKELPLKAGKTYSLFIGHSTSDDFGLKYAAGLANENF